MLADIHPAAVFLALALASIGYRFLAGYFRAEDGKKLPSARLGTFLVGNVVEYTKDPIAYVKEATSRYGHIFSVNMLFINTVWLRGLEINKYYLETKEDKWSFGGGMGIFLNKAVVPGYFDHLRTLVGSLNRGINRASTLEAYADLVADEADKAFAAWADKPEINLFDEMSFLVHKMITRCLMGPDFYEKNVDELYDLLHKIEVDIGHILNFILPDWVPHPPARRLRKARDRMQDIFRERLRERESNPEYWQGSHDYITYTLQDRVTAHLKEMFPAHHTIIMFAAHTSTVADIAWTVIELLNRPEWHQRVREDLVGKMTSDDHLGEHLNSETLNACLKETGRHYSGVTMLRLAEKESTLPNGMVVPKGSVVSISPYLTHHDPDLYQRPDEWSPDRFLDDPDLPKRVNADGKIGFLPFGYGSHRCPGEKFAWVMMAIVLGRLLRDYEVRWPTGKEAQDTSTLDLNKIGAPWAKEGVFITVEKKKTKEESAV